VQIEKKKYISTSHAIYEVKKKKHFLDDCDWNCRVIFQKKYKEFSARDQVNSKIDFHKLAHHTDHPVIIISISTRKGRSSNYLWCNNRIFTTNRMVEFSILLHGFSGYKRMENVIHSSFTHHIRFWKHLITSRMANLAQIQWGRGKFSKVFRSSIIDPSPLNAGQKVN